MGCAWRPQVSRRAATWGPAKRPPINLHLIGLLFLLGAVAQVHGRQQQETGPSDGADFPRLRAETNSIQTNSANQTQEAKDNDESLRRLLLSKLFQQQKQHSSSGAKLQANAGKRDGGKQDLEQGLEQRREQEHEPEQDLADGKSVSSVPEPAEAAPSSNVRSASKLLLLFALLILINLIVILGNILVILAVYATAKLRSVTNIFIVSLATADLMLGLFVLPYAMLLEVLDVWVFGRHWCRGWLVTDVWISTASILNLCAISVDRYVAVTRPVKYRSIMTPRRAKTIVACVWCVSFLICFPPLLPDWTDSSSSSGAGANSSLGAKELVRSAPRLQSALGPEPQQTINRLAARHRRQVGARNSSSEPEPEPEFEFESGSQETIGFPRAANSARNGQLIDGGANSIAAGHSDAPVPPTTTGPGPVRHSGAPTGASRTIVRRPDDNSPGVVELAAGATESLIGGGQERSEWAKSGHWRRNGRPTGGKQYEPLALVVARLSRLTDDELRRVAIETGAHGHGDDDKYNDDTGGANNNDYNDGGRNDEHEREYDDKESCRCLAIMIIDHKPVSPRRGRGAGAPLGRRARPGQREGAFKSAVAREDGEFIVSRCCQRDVSFASDKSKQWAASEREKLHDNDEDIADNNSNSNNHEDDDGRRHDSSPGARKRATTRAQSLRGGGATLPLSSSLSSLLFSQANANETAKTPARAARLGRLAVPLDSKQVVPLSLLLSCRGRSAKTTRPTGGQRTTRSSSIECSLGPKYGDSRVILMTSGGGGGEKEEEEGPVAIGATVKRRQENEREKQGRQVILRLAFVSLHGPGLGGGCRRLLITPTRLAPAESRGNFAVWTQNCTCAGTKSKATTTATTTRTRAPLGNKDAADEEAEIFPLPLQRLSGAASSSNSAPNSSFKRREESYNNRDNFETMNTPATTATKEVAFHSIPLEPSSLARRASLGESVRESAAPSQSSPARIKRGDGSLRRPGDQDIDYAPPRPRTKAPLELEADRAAAAAKLVASQATGKRLGGQVARAKACTLILGPTKASAGASASQLSPSPPPPSRAPRPGPGPGPGPLVGVWEPKWRINLAYEPLKLLLAKSYCCQPNRRDKRQVHFTEKHSPETATTIRSKLAPDEPTSSAGLQWAPEEPAADDGPGPGAAEPAERNVNDVGDDKSPPSARNLADMNGGRNRQSSGCALFHHKAYVIYSALGSFYIPMLIMIFFYSRIYLVASRAQKALQRGYMTTKSWPAGSAGSAKGRGMSARCSGVVASIGGSIRGAAGDGGRTNSSSGGLGPDSAICNHSSSTSRGPGPAGAHGGVSHGHNSSGGYGAPGPERVTLRIHRREKGLAAEELTSTAAAAAAAASLASGANNSNSNSEQGANGDSTAARAKAANGQYWALVASSSPTRLNTRPASQRATRQSQASGDISDNSALLKLTAQEQTNRQRLANISAVANNGAGNNNKSLAGECARLVADARAANSAGRGSGPALVESAQVGIDLGGVEGESASRNDVNEKVEASCASEEAGPGASVVAAAVEVERREAEPEPEPAKARHHGHSHRHHRRHNHTHAHHHHHRHHHKHHKHHSHGHGHGHRRQHGGRTPDSAGAGEQLDAGEAAPKVRPRKKSRCSCQLQPGGTELGPSNGRRTSGGGRGEPESGRQGGQRQRVCDGLDADDNNATRQHQKAISLVKPSTDQPADSDDNTSLVCLLRGANSAVQITVSQHEGDQCELLAAGGQQEADKEDECSLSLAADRSSLASESLRCVADAESGDADVDLGTDADADLDRAESRPRWSGQKAAAAAAAAEYKQVRADQEAAARLASFELGKYERSRSVDVSCRGGPEGAGPGAGQRAAVLGLETGGRNGGAKFEARQVSSVTLAGADEAERLHQPAPRVDRSHSYGPTPSIVVNWSAAGQRAETELVMMPAPAGQAAASATCAPVGAKAGGPERPASMNASTSGLSLIPQAANQVRKQSMMLLNTITTRGSQTLRRLSMVATNPVGSLLARSRSRGSNDEADDTSDGCALDHEGSSCGANGAETCGGSCRDEASARLRKRKRHKRRHRKSRSSTPGAPKRTFDDYLMAVTGIDGSSDEEGDGGGEGDGDEGDEEEDGEEDDEDDSCNDAGSMDSDACNSGQPIGYSLLMASKAMGESLLIPNINIVRDSDAGLAPKSATGSCADGTAGPESLGERGHMDAATSGQDLRPGLGPAPEPSGKLGAGGLLAQEGGQGGGKHGASTGGSLHRQGGYYERATSRASVERQLSDSKLGSASSTAGAGGAESLGSKQIEAAAINEKQLPLVPQPQPAPPPLAGPHRRRGAKRTSKWHAKRLRAETKAAKTVAIIIGGFIFCWLPFFTAYLSRAIICEQPDCIPQSLMSLFIWLGYLNSAINPVIYGLFSADFRHAFKNILCRCKFRNTDDTVVVSVLVDSIIKSIL